MALKNVNRRDADPDLVAINTIRTLSMDAVQVAHSGHPGTPMALAPLVYTLWQRILRFDPDDPSWKDRDRFVLSAGHASMLLYSILFLCGVKAPRRDGPPGEALAVPLEEIRRFRQIDSLTPGHPESGLTAGVETTTGPLGQGAGVSVGMAIGQRWLAARYNRPGFDLFTHRVWVVCSDGDMMEGVSSEAASLAGHLKLDNLCWIYDRNHISIEGSTDLAFSEDTAARFAAYGWHVVHVTDANDTHAIEQALQESRATTGRPTFIVLDSHIAYGAPHKQDDASAHGEPLGEEEVRLTKRFYGWPEDSKFLVPEGVREHLDQTFGARGRALHKEWRGRYEAYGRKHPDLAAELERMWSRQLPDGWDRDLPVFAPDPKGMATRQASGQVLNAIAQRIPWLIGGAADLAPSTRTLIKDGGDLEADNAGARNLHFGIREHAMGTILNGLAHQHLRPFGASFLIFSDYMRPPIRLASLMDLPVVYVFTHDSISLGEDGPTHQSIEQLASLRAVPGLTVIRPADANETSEALRAALSLGRPVVLALTRQPLPVLDRSDLAPASELCRGAYVLAEADGGPPELLLLASGSEVALCLEARRRLSSEGIRARVVSMPSWELFEEQEPGYHDRVLPPDVRVRIAVEEGSPLGWDRYTGADGCILGISTFGASAPYRDVERKFGFTAQNVAHLASEQLSRYWKGIRPSTAQRAGAGPEDRAAHRHAGAEIAP